MMPPTLDTEITASESSDEELSLNFETLFASFSCDEKTRLTIASSAPDKKVALTALDQFIIEPSTAKAIILWSKLSGLTIEPVSIIALLNRQLAELDELISEQVNAIMHHPSFQQMESRWLGLWHLVDESSQAKNIKIKLLDVSWRDLCRDLERASDFENTRLFHLIYNQEFGTAGGEPYSVLIGDYAVAHKPTAKTPNDDVFSLQVLSHIAASAFAPLICSAAPELFGINSFEEFNPQIEFRSIFSHPEYLRWNSLREQEDSRFIALTLPSVLMRSPLNNNFSAWGKFRFQEICEHSTAEKYLWGNSCFAFATVLIREFIEVGWFSHIRGVPRDYAGGGLVTSYAAPHYSVDSSATWPKSVTPTVLTDSMERQLSELGFITLSQGYNSEYAAFTNCPSIQKPQNYGSKSANANARISSMLQHILCGSRFAQYVKVIIREKIGSFTSAEDCQRTLQKWFDQYTSGRDDLGWEMLARKPLRKARVQVLETPGQLGAYQCIIHLKNHYTVDHLVAELRLSTSISKNAIGQG
jgi:type VI secretion system protein ImpD